MRALYLASFLLPVSLGAQSLVSTFPQNRTVLIEDLTGVNCQYCPEGHTIMANLKAAYPDRVVPLAIHAGVFATAAWTTPWGNAINTYYNPDGYPSGGVNRRLIGGTRALGRGAWSGATIETLGMTSPVNLGLASSFNSTTRELTVTVELRYTADSPGAADKLSVLLTENGIVAAQSSTTGTISNYVHNHVFRVTLTPTWGDEIASTTAGSTQTLTYTYQVPETWNVANFDVVAFIGEDQSEIYQAREVDMDGGTTLVIGDLTNVSGTHAGSTTGSAASFSADLANLMGGAADFVISLEPLSAPTDWTSSFTVAGDTHSGTATVNLPGGANESIAVAITPGSMSGIGKYKLSIASSAAPNAPVLTREFNVISGVTDLIVSNVDAFATSAQARYVTGLANAGNENFAATDLTGFMAFDAVDALGGIVNIYRNVSWAFPSLVDTEVAVLQEMMDNGVNLMIAGQDIGWDQSGASGTYGTVATRSFYTNYMLATYVADGSASNSPVNFVDEDLVFGALANSPVSPVFGSGTTYPDEITPIAPAGPILRYGSTTKIGGLRGQTANYKVVYMGVGPEQLASASVATATVTLSHDWFYGLVSVEEFDAAMGSLGQPYPVPADQRLVVPMDLKETVTLTLHDATGRIVTRRTVAAHTPQVELATGQFDAGMYTLRLQTADGMGTARSIVVAH